MLTGGNVVVLRLVYFEVQLLSVAFRRLFYEKTHLNEGHVELRKLVLHCGVNLVRYIEAVVGGRLSRSS